MELTNNSISIIRNPAYKYQLRLDYKTGFIRLTKIVGNSKTMRVTDKVVPVDMVTKDKFFYNRTGWAGEDSNLGFKNCSYVSKEVHPNKYEYWKQYIYEKYKKLKLQLKSEV